MTRIPRIRKREDIAEGGQAAYDEIRGSRGEVSGPFSVLLNSPEMSRRAAHLGAYIRFESSLPADVKELTILVTAREWDCQYEWTYHEPEARKAGVREEAIMAVRDRRAPSGLSDEEAVVCNYVLETMRQHNVSQGVYEAAFARFGAQGVADLTVTTGYYALLAGALNTFEVEVDAGATPLLPI